MSPDTPKQRRRRGRGTNIIEIMLGITILGLIAASVRLAVIPRMVEARQKNAALDIETLERALELYHAKTGRFPDTSAGLGVLVEARVLKQLPRDPWHNNYVYLDEGSGPVILSYGADGTAGGEGENADISSALDRSSRR